MIYQMRNFLICLETLYLETRSIALIEITWLSKYNYEYIFKYFIKMIKNLIYEINYFCICRIENETIN